MSKVYDMDGSLLLSCPRIPHWLNKISGVDVIGMLLVTPIDVIKQIPSLYVDVKIFRIVIESKQKPKFLF